MRGAVIVAIACSVCACSVASESGPPAADADGADAQPPATFGAGSAATLDASATRRPG